MMTKSRFKLTWLLRVVLGIACWYSILPLPAQAQAICPSIVRAIPLIPEITEQSSSNIERDFYTTTLSIEFRPGQLAILSSSPDGQDPTRADDRFWIQASPSGNEWSHDYRNAARTQIVPLPPQDISHLFVAGTNTLTVSVTDLIGPKYSAQPFYLVLFDTCPTPTPTVSPTATATAVPSATATPVPPTTTPIHTATPVIQLVVITATPSDTPLPTFTPVSPTLTATATLMPLPAERSEMTDFLANMTQWMLVGFLLSIGGTGLWWWAARVQPCLAGEIDVYQDGQYVTTYDLATMKKEVVTIGKHGDVLLPDLMDESPVARIKLSEDEGAVHHVAIIEQHSPYNAEDVLETTILTDGYELTVGPYRLQYRSYQPEEIPFEEVSDV
ncbi:MAG: hypothetical protein KDE58_37035 [Caldilineaceae bacterium]|nr:hypothetical protein [Caldilineaceae bacterium]